MTNSGHIKFWRQQCLKESGFVMREKNRMSDLYSRGKGEILWSREDILMRKRSTEMFFLVKNESSGPQDDPTSITPPHIPITAHLPSSTPLIAATTVDNPSPPAVLSSTAPGCSMTVEPHHLHRHYLRDMAGKPLTDAQSSFIPVAPARHPSSIPTASCSSRIVAMSFCEPRSWTRVLSS